MLSTNRLGAKEASDAVAAAVGPSGGALAAQRFAELLERAEVPLAAQRRQG